MPGTPITCKAWKSSCLNMHILHGTSNCRSLLPFRHALFRVSLPPHNDGNHVGHRTPPAGDLLFSPGPPFPIFIFRPMFAASPARCWPILIIEPQGEPLHLTHRIHSKNHETPRSSGSMKRCPYGGFQQASHDLLVNLDVNVISREHRASGFDARQQLHLFHIFHLFCLRNWSTKLPEALQKAPDRSSKNSKGTGNSNGPVGHLPRQNMAVKVDPKQLRNASLWIHKCQACRVFTSSFHLEGGWMFSSTILLKSRNHHGVIKHWK